MVKVINGTKTYNINELVTVIRIKNKDILVSDGSNSVQVAPKDLDSILKHKTIKIACGIAILSIWTWVGIFIASIIPLSVYITSVPLTILLMATFFINLGFLDKLELTTDDIILNRKYNLNLPKITILAPEGQKLCDYCTNADKYLAKLNNKLICSECIDMELDKIK